MMGFVKSPELTEQMGWVGWDHTPKESRGGKTCGPVGANLFDTASWANLLLAIKKAGNL